MPSPIEQLNLIIFMGLAKPAHSWPGDHGDIGENFIRSCMLYAYMLYRILLNLYAPVAKWLEQERSRHTKDVKTGRFVLLSLALGTNELGNQLASSESV